jgi:hypothetical protein
MDTFEAYLHMYYIFDIQVHCKCKTIGRKQGRQNQLRSPMSGEGDP